MGQYQILDGGHYIHNMDPDRIAEESVLFIKGL